ncbi:MAG: hypothetical protein LKK19_02070 [Bacteroidales bacterium]|jgi:hypothetical protein|nr:hypothetical protein [Bacteroidales bacterium]MCI2121472.1 hypothetical protein [Bacteroidales bacterium]MCI2145269.1 hypothetical protein [Bacteroidales bacterium]
MNKKLLMSALLALTFQAMSFTASAQATPQELLGLLGSMGAARVEYSYTQLSSSGPSVQMTGHCDIQENMWKVSNSDGSEFYCDGQSLWYKYPGEVTVYNVDSNSDDPMRNIKSFILKSTLTRNATGNIVLTKDREGGNIITLEITGMKKIPLKEKSYYVFDTSELGDDYYITDLR